MAKTNPTERPYLACEIFADRVLAARAAADRSFLEVHTSRQIPAGVVTPSLTATNVNDSAALSAIVQDALSAVAGKSRDVIAVVPDAATRIVLLDFDALPEDADAAAGVIRLRSKKSMPFDVEKARVAFHTYRQPSQPGVKVVAAFMLLDILREYEQVFVQAGYLPGVVLPSTLAALGAVNAIRPTLVVKVGAASTTLAIVDEDELRLFRSLDAAISANGLIEEVYPSLVFYQDTFGAAVEHVLVAGNAVAAELAPSFAEHFSGPVEELVEAAAVSGGLGADTKPGLLAGAVGALLK